jgi:hypothetical protein
MDEQALHGSCSLLAPTGAGHEGSGCVCSETRHRSPSAALGTDHTGGLRWIEVRVKGDGGYVLFKSPTIPHGFLPMHQEDGDWSVASIGGSSL